VIKEEIWQFPKIGSKKQRIWYTPESVSHPAKMNTLLTRKLITTFTKKGDLILDPMAGVGTTLVEGMILGRNVVGVDIEDKFVRLIEGNLKNVEEINVKGWFKLRLGKAQVLCGDSRNLAQLLQDKMDAVVTSPPYSGAISKHAGGDKVRERFEGFMGESQLEARKYSEDEGNIGNLAEHGRVDVVVTSPPFGMANRGSGIAKKGYAGRHGVDPKLHERHDRPLSDDPNNISNLPLGKVDTVLTSPPFARTKGGLTGGRNIIAKIRRGEKPKRDFGGIQAMPRPCSDDPKNIENLSYEKVDTVITSPPYGDGKKGEVSPERKAKDFEEHYVPEMGGKSFHTQQRLRGVKSLVSGYSDDPQNIGNLKLGEVDAVLTSPPYADGTKGKSRAALWERLAKDPTSKRFGRKKHPHIGEGYSPSKENIGNLKLGEVDAVLTSPPYADSKKGVANGEDWADRMEQHGSTVESRRERHTPGRLRAAKAMSEGYSENPNNIGNLPHEKDVSAIITSPPYSEGLGHGRGRSKKLQKEKGLHLHGAGSYSEESEENIGEIRTHGTVDTVITSPPYEGSLEGSTRHTRGGIASRDPKLAQTGTIATIITSPPYEGSVGASNDPNRRAERMRRAGLDPRTIVGGKARCGEIDWQYSENPENVGNLKGETYLEAMLKVYREMFKVLKPGGLAIIVLKNFIRNWKVIDLIGDTERLCKHVGFKLVKRIRFVLPQQSFWRTNYRIQYSKRFKKPFPEETFASVYRFETVLVFEKGLSTIS